MTPKDSMNLMNDFKLKCISCDQVYAPQKGLYFCPECGQIMGTLVVLYDYEGIKVNRESFSKRGSIQQFEALLPVKNTSAIADAVGGTPLLKFKNVFGMQSIYIKNDGMNLSASFKDRASLVAVNMASAEGYDKIFCASTGNAASSLALVSASSTLETVIFVPKSIPAGKLAQLKAAGVDVRIIDGNYDEAFDTSLAVGLEAGWYCRNSAINPYNLEGKKTAAFEILVQMDYEVPDYCFVGVGDGTVVSSLVKGFDEFKKIGLVDKTPVVIGVQAAGAATLKKVFDCGEPFTPIREEVHTLADSISVGYPRDVIKACKFLKASGGDLISVEDISIQRAIKAMATETGVFAEPAGAIALAGLWQLLEAGRVHKEDRVVLVVTGNGLKDPGALGGVV